MNRHTVFIMGLAMFLFFCGTSYADLSEDLIAYWPFNGNANDESGNLNHGEVYGAILTEDRFGNPDSAYSFDGLDDYVNIDKSIISEDSFTYSVWAKREGTGLTNDTILCNWSNNEGGPALIDWGVKNADEIRFLSGEYDGSLNVRLFTYSYVTNDWTNIVLARNGRSSASAHINGEEIGFADLIPAKYSTNIFHIGRYDYTNPDTRYFNGSIDDIRIYNRALSNDEINELVNPNISPVADAGGPYLVAVDQTIALDGSGSYDEDGDPLGYVWTQKDTLGSFGDPSSENPTYAGSQAGITDLTLTVSDGQDDDSDTAMLVVYDPSEGFVTGGGWIWSPAGAYADDLLLEGKANFGFVSKYKKGASVPTGNTEFVFQAADLNFHSSSYQWLVVNQGGTNAQFKGFGTVNGMGDYKFMLWAGDDDPDTFRIKIWWEDGETENVIYDNGMDQEIGGSIVIHQK